jgi:hypothetical protein
MNFHHYCNGLHIGELIASGADPACHLRSPDELPHGSGPLVNLAQFVVADFPNIDVASRINHYGMRSNEESGVFHPSLLVAEVRQ